MLSLFKKNEPSPGKRQPYSLAVEDLSLSLSLSRSLSRCLCHYSIVGRTELLLTFLQRPTVRLYVGRSRRRNLSWGLAWQACGIVLLRNVASRYRR